MNVKQLSILLTLISLSLPTQAEAQSMLSQLPATSAPASDQAAPASPAFTDAASSVNSIESLKVEQDSELVSPEERSDRLDSQAAQINQRLNAGSRRGTQLRDLLHLPDGMIIRGSSRGGIGIGAEY